MDDSPHFLEAASKLIKGEGLDVVGVASTSAEALARVDELAPDVAIVDVGLGDESGFDLAWQLAATSNGMTTNTVLTSTRSESDFAELVAVTPSLGFISKNELSGDAIRDFLTDQRHGGGCRHEALVYSSTEELAAGALPFMRHGLARGEHVLVILREAGRIVLEQRLEKTRAVSSSRTRSRGIEAPSTRSRVTPSTSTTIVGAAMIRACASSRKSSGQTVRRRSTSPRGNATRPG